MKFFKHAEDEVLKGTVLAGGGYVGHRQLANPTWKHKRTGVVMSKADKIEDLASRAKVKRDEAVKALGRRQKEVSRLFKNDAARKADGGIKTLNEAVKLRDASAKAVDLQSRRIESLKGGLGKIKLRGSIPKLIGLGGLALIGKGLMD